MTETRFNLHMTIEMADGRTRADALDLAADIQRLISRHGDRVQTCSIYDRDSDDDDGQEIPLLPLIGENEE